MQITFKPFLENRECPHFLKYLGYSIIVFRKRPVVEEPELFIDT